MEKVKEPELSNLESDFMQKAFDYAYKALAAQEVPVGCIFVYNNQIVAVGRNEVNQTKNATRHAEMVCIDQTLDYCKLNSLNHINIFKQLSVYVTVEPCIMCAAALYQLKIEKIVFGCKNERFGGETVLNVGDILKPATIIKGGYRKDEAMCLLKEFYKGQNPSAPIHKVKIKNKVHL